MAKVQVVDFDPAWPQTFAALKAPLKEGLGDLILDIVHVGSTAVPGLAAKPIIDIDVIIPSRAQLPAVIAGLARLGYVHQGDRGIEGRESFSTPAGRPAHHVYVCEKGCTALANHLAVRDYLRAHPQVRARYGILKQQLAACHPDDVNAYIAGKTAFLLQILAESGLPQAALRQIRDANDRGAPPIRLRPATPADLALLRAWDEQPHIVSARANGAWGDELELARAPDWRLQLIAESCGRPIGFVQIIDPAREDSHYWGEIEPHLRAIDLWIGEPHELGQGHGTRMMRLALERCFAEPAVTAVLVDPLVSNTRAQRFFERMGFQFLERRCFGEDDCCVYRLPRPAAPS